ncbi:MAG: DUF1456 family protein [Aureispira sp.]|nr:DUF1456 family protein [Aureispira sp.]
MNNNDIIRQLRYTFSFGDDKMIEIFRLAEHKVTRTEVCDWLKKDENPEQLELTDEQLAIFLNGFINLKRGKREGPQPAPEKVLTNNAILRKIKIALNLKDHDLLELLSLVDMRISKHELSAFFRKPSQKQYRVCHDQILRKLLHGMQLEYHKD